MNNKYSETMLRPRHTSMTPKEGKCGFFFTRNTNLKYREIRNHYAEPSGVLISLNSTLPPS